MMNIRGPLTAGLLTLLAAVLPLASPALGQAHIRLNQVGFYPDAPKQAVVTGASGLFHVVDAERGDTILTAPLGNSRFWSHSNENARLADFTAVDRPGRYRIRLEDGTQSHIFRVADYAHEAVAWTSMKAFYYQRASTALDERHAGRWHRRAGHPDNLVRIHASAASPGRPTNSTILAQKGWYDAGDYNKYVVNSGISTYTVLAIYEHFPAYARHVDLNIPESGGPVPDILAEALWNLRWMLRMQDPHDGGVYHKLTSANFSGAVMPHQDTGTRYVVQKSTAAALNFAAVMAQASRIFRAYDEALPQLADSMHTAAINAWMWARRNPAAYYNQAAMNQQFSPTINTGEYGDTNVSDEFAWAAIELHITTGADSLLAAVGNHVSGRPIPSWQQVRMLGYLSVLAHRESLGAAARVSQVQTEVVGLATSLRNARNTSAYGVAMGMEDWHFIWGSNALAANQGIILLNAYRLTGDRSFLDTALSNLDYVLGRNATGYSFVTGHGSVTPMHPHHRPSRADGIPEPVPGFLVGGPNRGREDLTYCQSAGVQYPSALRALAYVDDWCSWASNEVAINWNAALAYLAIGVEASMSTSGLPSGIDGPPATFPPADRLQIESVFPHPARERTSILLSLPEGGELEIHLSDLLGRVVTRLHDSFRPAGTSVIELDLPLLPSGAYILHVRHQSGSASHPLIVRR
jgi:endoglucanase